MSGSGSTETSAGLTTAPTPEPDGDERPASRATDVIWFLLRNGVLPWVALVVAALCAGVLAMRGAPWRADLLWIIDWIPIGHIAIAPVVAGGAAIDTARLGAAVRHTESARWSRSAGTAVALGYAAVVAGVYAAAVAAAVLVEIPPSFDPRALLAIAVQLLMLALFAAVGTVVGRVLGPVLAGIVGALVSLLAIYIAAARTEHVALLYAGASLVSRVGRSYDVPYLAAQGGLLLVLIIAFLMWRPNVVRGRWRRTGERAVVPVAVGLVVLAGALGPSSRLTYTGVPPTLCSDVDGVRICLYPEHARLQEEVGETLGRVFVAARAAGYGALVPDEVREAPVTGVTSWRGASLTLDEPLGGAPVDVRFLIQELVEPLHCEQLRGPEPPSDRYSQDLSNVMGTWLELVDPELTERWGWPYQVLDPPELARVLTEFRTCEYQFR